MTISQGQVCGHWTQLIWANTVKVGCARKTCATVPNYPQFNGGTIGMFQFNNVNCVQSGL